MSLAPSLFLLLCLFRPARLLFFTSIRFSFPRHLSLLLYFISCACASSPFAAQPPPFLSLSFLTTLYVQCMCVHGVLRVCTPLRRRVNNPNSVLIEISGREKVGCTKSCARERESKVCKGPSYIAWERAKEHFLFGSVIYGRSSWRLINSRDLFGFAAAGKYFFEGGIERNIVRERGKIDAGSTNRVIYFL